VTSDYRCNLRFFGGPCRRQCSNDVTGGGGFLEILESIR
jgi:hypothetical protein